jgi:cytochrome c-type biogenesis protein CcmH/NrfG
MSSRYVVVLTVLTAFLTAVLVIPVQPVQAQTGPIVSLAELLLRDEILQLEGRLAASPASAERTAFEGEVAYRKGHFDEAERLYRAALQRNEKTARAHFGLGKLALARMKGAEAEKAFKRAVSLDGKEPIYRFYLSDALSIENK